jgi:hypothetical protein
MRMAGRTIAANDEAMQGKTRSAQDVFSDNFETLVEFWEFWDTHSSADFEDVMDTVEIEIDPLSSTVYLPVAKDLVNKVRAQARRQGVSSETLVSLWLQERLAAVA